MKKLLSSAVLGTVVLAFLSLSSCSKQTDDPTPEEQITGKWTMREAIGSYTMNGMNHKDTTRYTANDYFEFKSDGTLSIIETNTTYNGNWNITGGKLYITNTGYMDYSRGFDLPVLTQSDLQLYYTESANNSTLEQKLNLTK